MSTSCQSSHEGGSYDALFLLTLLFIGLKLTGFIDWSWWWVLSPLWLPLAIVAVVLLVIWLGLVVLD